MKIFKELPIVLPFYELQENQDRYRENVAELCPFKLISPRNALLPFQIEMPLDKGALIAWDLVSACENPTGTLLINLTSQLNKVKIYEFTDKKQAVYFGDVLGGVSLACGYYYTRFRFNDGSQYVSEVFYIPADAFDVGQNSRYMRLEFWNDKDIDPVLYRDNFKQIIYLDNFVSSFMPEIEEEQEKDGFNNEIPIFQKLIMKYKIHDVVPDFIKIALISLQMMDNVYIYINSSRSGKIDRISVNSQPYETGAFNDVELTFEDDIMYKTACNTNKQLINAYTW